MATNGNYCRKQLSELEEEPDGTALLKAISWGKRGLGAEEVTMSMSILKPGQSIQHHRHANREEVYAILKGTSQLMIEDDAPIDAKAYEFYLIKKGVMHSVANNSNEDAHWMFVAGPLSSEERKRIEHT